MNNVIITGVIAASIFLAGCGKKNGSSGSSDSTTKALAEAAPSSTVTQQALTAWEQGDKSTAIDNFLETDWSARPLFASGSTLNLSEDQFKSLSDAERQMKSSELSAQFNSLRELTAVVLQAGHDAASKGDTAQARKCFTSLKQCGTVLGGSDHLQLVQLFGQSLKQKAEAELAKIGQ
jgi:major membrane immunogen (membrane-anchored lipoprotein)